MGLRAVAAAVKALAVQPAKTFQRVDHEERYLANFFKLFSDAFSLLGSDHILPLLMGWVGVEKSKIRSVTTR